MPFFEKSLPASLDFLSDKRMKKRGNWRRKFKKVNTELFTDWGIALEKELKKRLSRGLTAIGKKGSKFKPLAPSTIKFRERVKKKGMSLNYKNSESRLYMSGNLFRGLKVKTNANTFEYEIINTAKPIHYTGKHKGRSRNTKGLPNGDYSAVLDKARPHRRVPGYFLDTKSEDSPFNKIFRDIQYVDRIRSALGLGMKEYQSYKMQKGFKTRGVKFTIK